MSLVLPLIGCGDDGKSADEAAGSETAETGTEGDGDGDPTGDGDGDPTGDGDGDPTGDGDGEPACIPVDDSECSMCTAANCCPEIMACEASEDCECFTTCVFEGNDAMQCSQTCMVNPMMIPELMELRACNLMNCMQQCA
jgi:hypothetical protein